MAAAARESSQKPGSPMRASSSRTRSATRSGSKVITDPGELGPDLLELSLQRLSGLGHVFDASWLLPPTREAQARPRLVERGDLVVDEAGVHAQAPHDDLRQIRRDSRRPLGPRDPEAAPVGDR